MEDQTTEQKVLSKEDRKKWYNDLIEMGLLHLEYARIQSEIAQHDCKRLQAIMIMAELQGEDPSKEQGKKETKEELKSTTDEKTV